MPIKNYTTKVSAMKSIGEIQGNLVAHGARAIMVNYGEDMQPENIAFIITTKHGDMPFRLPANVKTVATLLLEQISSSNYRQLDNTYQTQRQAKALEQAARVAWRIIKNWVDAQMAIIETEMVTIEQVFLPYMQVKEGKTLYETMIERGFIFPSLPEGKG